MIAAGLLLLLLWLQLALGPFGFFGWDWSLCGLLVLSLTLRPGAAQLAAVGLGLVRDAFSITPLGSQALGLGISVAVVQFLRSLVFLESFWSQGILFFTGYLFYQVAFFGLGKFFGFLEGGFGDIFISAIPKAVGAAVFCWLMTWTLSRFYRKRFDL